MQAAKAAKPAVASFGAGDPYTPNKAPKVFAIFVLLALTFRILIFHVHEFLIYVYAQK